MFFGASAFLQVGFVGAPKTPQLRSTAVKRKACVYVETTKRQAHILFWGQNPSVICDHLLFIWVFCCSLAVYLLLSVVHGSQATPVYTLMLQCSQNAPPSVRTTCYSFLGTLEILGKQLSLFMAGVLTETLGYVAALHISLAVSFFVVILVWHCPKYLKYS